MRNQPKKNTVQTPEEYFRHFEDEYDIEFCSPKEVLDAMIAYVDSSVKGYAQSNQHFMMISEPGCVAEGTMIKVNRNGLSRQFPVEDLYRKFWHIDLKKTERGFDPKIPCMIRAWKGDHIGLHPVDKILRQGKKFVRKLLLTCGFCIELTDDHEVLTRRGWVQLQNLTLDDEVAIDTTTRHQKKKNPTREKKHNYNTITVGKFYQGTKRRWPRSRSKHRTPMPFRTEKHIAVYEAWMNGMTLADFQAATHKPNNLKFLDRNIYSVHHKNRNHHDNALDNLECLETREHLARHASENPAGGYLHFGHGEINWSGVEEISPPSEKETYDIVCRDPHRNFVANGIVVHNCGKSSMFYQMCAAKGVHPVEVRVSCSDEGVIVGCPTKTEDGGFRYSIDQRIKDRVEEGKKLGKRIAVFFDELNRGKQHMVNGVFNIIDNKVWAGYKLPEDTMFFVAVNPATEMHSVIDIMREAALNRRFVIIGVEPSAKSWLEYADTKPEIHKLVKDFVKSNPKSIMEIGKMNQGKKYLCPAVLESLGRRLTAFEQSGINMMEIAEQPGVIRLLCAAAGKSAGMALVEFITARAKNIDPAVILKDYDSVRSSFKGGSKKVDQGFCVSAAKTLAEHIAAFTPDFEVEKDAGKNLARFMDDCNEEVLRTFLNHLHTSFQSGTPKDQYIQKMTDSLVVHEEFINATKRIHAGYRRAEKALDR